MWLSKEQAHNWHNYCLYLWCALQSFTFLLIVVHCLCKQYENVNWFTFWFTEVGKGYITPWDLERMATINDFIWTDSEISNMIRCFDSDGDGKINLEDFRSIVSRCNMLQEPEKRGWSMVVVWRWLHSSIRTVSIVWPETVHEEICRGEQVYEHMNKSVAFLSSLCSLNPA